jgi:hypothetical protein
MFRSRTAARIVPPAPRALREKKFQVDFPHGFAHQLHNDCTQGVNSRSRIFRSSAPHSLAFSSLPSEVSSKRVIRRCATANELRVGMCAHVCSRASQCAKIPLLFTPAIPKNNISGTTPTLNPEPRTLKPFFPRSLSIRQLVSIRAVGPSPIRGRTIRTILRTIRPAQNAAQDDTDDTDDSA